MMFIYKFRMCSFVDRIMIIIIIIFLLLIYKNEKKDEQKKTSFSFLLSIICIFADYPCKKQSKKVKYVK